MLAELRGAALASGPALRFVQQGPSTGDAILMLHGLTDSWFSFSRLLPLLPDSFQVIVPDQRGHGSSGRPADDYSMDAFVIDALQLMNALGIERATVVGHSMGSFVARRMAAMAPSRVERLVLLGTGSSTRNEALTSLRLAVQTLSDPVDARFAREFQLSTIHRQIPLDFLERVVADSSRVPARVWKAALDGIIEFSDEPELITARTLVLGGDQDAVFPVDEQRAAARAIPGARLRIFSDVGHALHWEDPFSVAAELMAFVQAGRSPDIGAGLL